MWRRFLVVAFLWCMQRVIANANHVDANFSLLLLLRAECAFLTFIYAFRFLYSKSIVSRRSTRTMMCDAFMVGHTDTSPQPMRSHNTFPTSSFLHRNKWLYGNAIASYTKKGGLYRYIIAYQRTTSCAHHQCCVHAFTCTCIVEFTLVGRAELIFTVSPTHSPESRWSANARSGLVFAIFGIRWIDVTYVLPSTSKTTTQSYFLHIFFLRVA